MVHHSARLSYESDRVAVREGLPARRGYMSENSIEGLMPLCSKSEIETFEACKRKWAFNYVLRIRTPQSDSAKLGDDVDGGQLQPYYRDGREFDYTKPSGYIAASGLVHLPPRDPSFETQRYFSIPSPSSR